MQNLPRTIDPSLIQEGDTIIARWPKDQGIVCTFQGVVHERRIGNKGFTHFITREGGTILTWRVADRSKIVVTLVSREPAAQTPMFGMDEIRERVR
jgi:hypothetical protein